MSSGGDRRGCLAQGTRRITFQRDRVDQDRSARVYLGQDVYCGSDPLLRGRCKGDDVDVGGDLLIIEGAENLWVRLEG